MDPERLWALLGYWVCEAALGQSSGFPVISPESSLSLSSVRGLFSPGLQNNQQSAIGNVRERTGREEKEAGKYGGQCRPAVAPCPLASPCYAGLLSLAFPAKVA